MRLLALAHAIGPTGASVLLVQLLQRAAARGWTVDLLAPDAGERTQALAAAGVHPVAAARPGDYDVVLVNGLPNVQQVLDIGAQVPVLFWVHEGLTLLTLGHPSMPRWAEAFRLARRVVFNTAWQANTVFAPCLQGVAPARIAVATPGPAAALAARLPAAPVPAGQRPRRVLWLGSVYARKRPQDLVQALLRLDDTGVHCDLVGHTGLMGTLDAPTRELLLGRTDRFTLHGELPETAVAALLAQARVLCHPSGDETFGMAPMEAALAGAALALSALPCYQGLWHHGLDCLQHPVGATDLLAWNLRALLLDDALASRLAAAAAPVARRHAAQPSEDRVLALLEAAARERP